MVKAIGNITLIRVDDGAKGDAGDTLSTGKLMYKDVMFAEGNNGIDVYNNLTDSTVEITRQASSSDNPCGDHELVITNTGAASPGIGGFCWANQARANAVFIYRIIAKIPIGRIINWNANTFGSGSSIQWLTSQAGTGKFTEYIMKATCGSSGLFETIGFFYLNGSAGTVSSPVTWYLAYAGVWDMTSYEDYDKRIVKAETAIENTQDLISLKATTEEVTEIANRADELDNALQEAQTLIEQNRTAIGELSMSSSDFVVKFEKITKQITNLNGDLSSYKEEIGNWMRFDSDGNLVLGATRVAGQDAYELKLTKNRISFMLNDIEVAYISSNQLYITNSTVVQNLKIGGFTWEVRANGNLGLIYR